MDYQCIVIYTIVRIAPLCPQSSPSSSNANNKSEKSTTNSCNGCIIWMKSQIKRYTKYWNQIPRDSIECVN